MALFVCLFTVWVTTSSKHRMNDRPNKPTHEPFKNQHMDFGDWSSLRYHLSWAYEGGVWPPARVGSYSNMHTSCWLIRKGTVKVTTEDQTVHGRAGQWVFVASPTRHQAFSKHAEILSLNFDFTWPGNVQVIERPQNLVLSAADYPRLETAARKIVRLVGRVFPDAHAFLRHQPCTLNRFLKVQNLLPDWLDAYLDALADVGIYPRRLHFNDERVLKVLAELDRHPLSEPFTPVYLTALSGLSRSRLDALFVSALDTTPRRYFEKRRLEEARSLLVHTSKSVKEIAIELGFKHASHFSLWFQKHHQMSALDHRRLYQPKLAMTRL